MWVWIHMATATGSPARSATGTWTNIKASVQALLDAGAQAQQEIRDVDEGKLIAAVKDTDGNVIGLIQPS
jgi:predicted enzyme related to lactoylglutathione lyase